MTQRWEETLDRQLDLSRSLGDPKGQSRIVAESFARALESTGHLGGDVNTLTRDLPDRLSAMVFNADPVYVDPDMMTVWEAAIEGFKPEPLARTDLITPAGFLVLPRPVFWPDVHGLKMSYRAILWHPQQVIIHAGGSNERAPGPPDPGHVAVPVKQLDDRTWQSDALLVSLWHDPADTDDYDRKYGSALPTTGEKLRGLFLTHVMPWHWGEDWGGDYDEQGAVLRPLQSLWRLMLQTIADTGKYRASGPFRKRWERATWPEKHVTVVKLRRPRHEEVRDGEPTPVAWTHQWIVRGFWRWQWHPVEGAGACGHRYDDGRICDKTGGRHMQIWVSPFVKGPSHLELIVKKATVFEFVR